MFRRLFVVVAATIVLVGATAVVTRSEGAAAPAAAQPAPAGTGIVQFDPTGPVRIMDTRIGLGILGTCPCEPGLMPTLTSGGPIPPEATAVFVNVTVIAAAPSTYGFVAVHAGATPWKGNSTISWNAPGVYSNMALAPMNQGLIPPGIKTAQLNYQGSGHIDVVVDLLGWVLPTSG